MEIQQLKRRVRPERDARSSPHCVRATRSLRRSKVLHLANRRGVQERGVEGELEEPSASDDPSSFHTCISIDGVTFLSLRLVPNAVPRCFLHLARWSGPTLKSELPSRVQYRHRGRAAARGRR